MTHTEIFMSLLDSLPDSVSVSIRVIRKMDPLDNLTRSEHAGLGFIEPVHGQQGLMQSCINQYYTLNYLKKVKPNGEVNQPNAQFGSVHEIMVLIT